MHPEKRRAGRAIRKARRELRPILENISEGFDVLVEGLRAAFAAWGEVFGEIAKALATPPARNQYALTPGPGSFHLPEAPAGDPSQTGVQRATEAHSAFDDDNPFEGIGDD